MLIFYNAAPTSRGRGPLTRSVRGRVTSKLCAQGIPSRTTTAEGTCARHRVCDARPASQLPVTPVTSAPCPNDLLPPTLVGSSPHGPQ